MNIHFLKLIVTYFIFLQSIKIVISDNTLCSGCIIQNNICIKNTESTENCDKFYCKPDKTNTACYDCTDTLKSSNSKYYSIENGHCISKRLSDCGKIIYESNQCVDSCPESIFEFGDFCYSSCYEDEFGLEENGSKCKCKEGKYLIKNTVETIESFKCVDACPSGYFDFRTRACVDKCEGTTNKINTDNSCTDTCPAGQFLFTLKETINGETITKLYCVTNCPDTAKFYYTNNPPNKEKECISQCKNGHFYSIDESNKYECLEDCDTGLAYIDLNANIFQCKQSVSVTDTTECEKSFPYKYKNACLRNCTDTQKLLMFSNKTTYFLVNKNDINKKYCSENCQEGDLKYFKNSNTFTCHENCEETSNKFNFNNECVNLCDSFHPYHIKETGTCVTKCEEGNSESIKYYLLAKEKTCYKEPPKGTDYKYFDVDSNEWNTCKIPKIHDNPSYGEGFIFDNKCYKSCLINDQDSPVQKYHIINDNNCIEDCRSDNIYKYSIGGTEKNYICYPSCKDIPGDYKYEYKFRCYNSISGEFMNKNFYIESGIYKYFDINNNDELIKYCIKLGLYYLKDNQCVKDCDSSEKKVAFTKDTRGNINSLGKCLDATGFSYDSYYFSIEENIYYESCPYKTYEKESKKYCTFHCPTDFPFESEDGKSCKDRCDKYYILNEGKKICVEDCKTYSKFNFTTDKICVDQCVKQTDSGNYYYYYNSKNECLDTCIGNKENEKNIEFALKADIIPQPCIEECSGLNKYYYISDKICISQCFNGFIKSEGAFECVSSCDPDKPYIVDNTTCTDTCPGTAPFIAEVSFKSSTIKRCTSNCENESSNFKFYHCHIDNGKTICECLSSCGSSLYEYGKECLSDCPSGFYKESNKCLTKCNSKFFFKNEKGVYECKDSCNDGQYITSINECVSKCPINENYIGENNKCKNKCDPIIDGEYYYLSEVQEQTTSTPEYNIYKCSKTTGADDCKYILDGTNECVSSCNEDKPYDSPDLYCYSTCLKSSNYPFTDKINKKCVNNCPQTAKYYDEEKICINECRKLVNLNDNSCVDKCDITSIFKYSNETHCIDSCNKYTINDYKCYDNEKCPKPFNYISGKICSVKCPENEIPYANPIINDGEESIDEYICKSSCDPGLYTYEAKKLCLKECLANQYELQNDNKCVDTCDGISTNGIKYFFYEAEDENSFFKNNRCVFQCPSDKPYIDIDNHCSANCKYDGYKYYLYSNKTCTDKCPNGYKKNGLECVLECPQNTEEEKYLYLDETDTCIESCENSLGGYSYFYKTDRKCLKKCNETDFIYKVHECVSSCPEDSPYIYERICSEKCPSNQRYYIGFENGEQNTNKYCYNDCRVDYQFYIQEENGNRKCLGLCEGYYKTNVDPNVIAKECLTSCQYYVTINDTHKECFDLCPNDKRYYAKQSENIYQCFEKCPSTAPYHLKDEFLCMEKCDSNFANETNGECISSCGLSSRFWIKKKIDANNEITLCLNNCSEVNLQMYTPSGECVNSCDESKFLTAYKKNSETFCECMNLYYFDDSGVKTCFNNETTKCGEKNKQSENYPYIINGTSQCTKDCLGILSPSEDICYLQKSENFICPQNTQLGIYDNKIKCDCKYKFYYDMNNNNYKVCLDENENCPNEYHYLKEDKNECSKNCDGYNIIFDDKCLDICPLGMDEKDTESGKTCACQKYYYKESESKYICVEQCTENYPYLIEETNECVKNCSETKYNILYKNKCILSCGNNMITVHLDEGAFSCICKYIWVEGGECKEENKEKSCSDLDMKYLIKKTNQCVRNCPEKYNYYFNLECFSNCSEAYSYGYNVEEKSASHECKCKKFWKYNAQNLIECVDECGDNEILLKKTSQCIAKSDNFKCPYDMPYLYNKICDNKCPNGTTIDIIKGDSCICKNKWFKKDNELIHCFENKEDNCPDAYPYLINMTNECVKEISNCINQNYPKVFNYICYSNCPFLTNTKNNVNLCECNDTRGYWYKKRITPEDPKEYYFCNLNECPSGRNYSINGTKECVSKCNENEKYEYSNVCYRQCPILTEAGRDGSTCEFSEKNKTLEELVGYIGQNIIELSPNLPTGGLVINNAKGSLQIYGLKNGLNNKDSIKRTNLAYLDLSGCIKKIFSSNNLNISKDEIIVIKLDLKSNATKLVVNPVEYQFINSRTGEILDASICEKNEVIISYPITYIFKSNKNLRNLEISQDEEADILNKFNKGKLIYEEDNSIDTFNLNSSIYTDICIPIVIEGKDLVLEDRINYLFPNYSLCESICIYDHTDFNDERIYCNCSIKSQIDIDREQDVKLYQIDKNETDSNQKGPTNIPVLKCISNAKISGNGAFYFCLIIIIIEIGLLILVILYSISSLMRKIKKKLGKNKEEDIYNSNNAYNIEYNESENNKIKTSKFNKIKNNKSSNIKSSNRKINKNPPKRKGEEKNDEEIKVEENPINSNKGSYKYEIIEKNTKVNEIKNFDIFSEGLDNNKDLNQYLQNNGIQTEKGFLLSMREEENLLRTKYKYSLKNDNFDSVVVVLTSIFDKIYLIRILLLPDKFEIIPLMVSLYLLCHMILLTFLAFFYDIKTIKKIWTEESYPNFGYYLLYGFLANVIVWVIYRLFCCLLNNEHKIKKLDNINGLDKNTKDAKISRYIYKIKRNIIIYFALQFILIMFCSFYLITFCGIYIGTKSKLFQSYAIAFIEIIIIKIIYGLILGILRKVSLVKESSFIYNLILIFNKYIS